MSKVIRTEVGTGGIRGPGKVTDVLLSLFMLIISGFVLMPVVFIAHADGSVERR